MPSNIMKRYEQLLAKRAGLAVVQARDGHCKGCNMGLPPQLFIKIQRADVVETCPACGRILYHESALGKRVEDGAVG
jgi:predicted  nucleic acid-binding Zn-ribbon protein